MINALAELFRRLLRLEREPLPPASALHASIIDQLAHQVGDRSVANCLICKFEEDYTRFEIEFCRQLAAPLLMPLSTPAPHDATHPPGPAGQLSDLTVKALLSGQGATLAMATRRVDTFLTRWLTTLPQSIPADTGAVLQREVAQTFKASILGMIGDWSIKELCFRTRAPHYQTLYLSLKHAGSHRRPDAERKARRLMDQVLQPPAQLLLTFTDDEALLRFERDKCRVGDDDRDASPLLALLTDYFLNRGSLTVREYTPLKAVRKQSRGPLRLKPYIRVYGCIIRRGSLLELPPGMLSACLAKEDADFYYLFCHWPYPLIRMNTMRG